VIGYPKKQKDPWSIEKKLELMKYIGSPHSSRQNRRLHELRRAIHVRRNLVLAFKSGHARTYVAEVANAGAMCSAEFLTVYLCNSDEGQSALRTTSAQLLDPKLLRGIPEGSRFLSRMFSKLSDPTLDATRESKADLIRALLKYAHPSDLRKVRPLNFGGSGARLIAASFSTLPVPLEWAEAAVALEDEALFKLLRCHLSQEDLFLLWRKLPEYSISMVKFLFSQDVRLPTAEQMHSIFDLLPLTAHNQPSLTSLLVEGWPHAAATYQIKVGPKSRHDFWDGRALRTLLEAGATLHRADWLDIFMWDFPEVWSNQMRGLQAIPRGIHDWNIPNVTGTGFLEEILCVLPPQEKEKRRLVLEWLLASGADPRSALASGEPLNLSASESQIMQDVAKGRSIKSKNSNPAPPMTSEIELA